MVAPNFPFQFWHRHFFAILLFPARFTGQNGPKIAGSVHFGKLKVKQKYRSEGAL